MANRHVDVDVIIVGAGVAGSSLAVKLGRQGHCVAVIEKHAVAPSTFVGELLQPRGHELLYELGLESALQGIDAQRIYGMAVIDKEKRYAFPFLANRASGFAFHHSRFVEQLRMTMRGNANVQVIGGTVTELIKEDYGLPGVSYRDPAGAKKSLRARLVVSADGRHSVLRKKVLADNATQLSFSIGILVESAKVPFRNHGHVIVASPAPILAYPISSTQTRLLIDLPGPLPNRSTGQFSKMLIEKIVPQLPHEIRGACLAAITANTDGRNSGSVQIMPTHRLKPSKRAATPKVVFIGDALNIRHPLTGSGMTVALNDSKLLANALLRCDLVCPQAIQAALKYFRKERASMSASVDTLSGALYDVLKGSTEGQLRIRNAMYAYWELGGPTISGPIRLLSGLTTRRRDLAFHYFSISALAVAKAIIQPHQKPHGLKTIRSSRIDMSPHHEQIRSDEAAAADASIDDAVRQKRVIRDRVRSSREVSKAMSESISPYITQLLGLGL